MKKSIFISFMLSLLLIFTACSNTEIKESLDPNGSKIRYSVRKGTDIKEGLYQVLDSSGKLTEEVDYINNAPNGRRRLFYPNGQLQREESVSPNASNENPLEKSILNGSFTEFYENGKPKIKGKFDQNKQTGLWEYYHDNGLLKLKHNFVLGIEDGPFEEYHKNGKIAAKGSFKQGTNAFGLTNEDDMEHGELLIYDTLGTLIRKMNCNYGVCTTTWKIDSTKTQ